MNLTGEQVLSLSREQVWAALNDPAILQQCIPGCDTFEATAENQYKVIMTATVGPIKAKFTGRLVLSDLLPPESYKLSFDGSGGPAGTGKGNAQVALETIDNGTRLKYTVNAQVGGRLAQVGSRLIDGVAKKMADDFFSRFKKTLEPKAKEALPDSAQPADHAVATEAKTTNSGSKVFVVVGLVVAVLAIAAYLAG